MDGLLLLDFLEWFLFVSPQTHYSQLTGRIAVHHVSISTISAPVLDVINLIDTSAADVSKSSKEQGTTVGTGLMSLAPVLAVQQYGYQECVTAAINTANNVYMDFLQSEEGRGFHGEVS